MGGNDGVEMMETTGVEMTETTGGNDGTETMGWKQCDGNDREMTD